VNRSPCRTGPEPARPIPFPTPDAAISMPSQRSARW